MTNHHPCPAVQGCPSRRNPNPVDSPLSRFHASGSEFGSDMADMVRPGSLGLIGNLLQDGVC